MVDESMRCYCDPKSHEVGCWFHPAGYYLNGVKIASLPRRDSVRAVSFEYSVDLRTTAPAEVLA